MHSSRTLLEYVIYLINDAIVNSLFITSLIDHSPFGFLFSFLLTHTRYVTTIQSMICIIYNYSFNIIFEHIQNVFSVTDRNNNYFNQLIHFRLFQLGSIGIIDDNYGNDPEEAMDLIDSYSDVWQIRSTPLAFAHENFFYDVVAHPLSKHIINRKWYNNLQPGLKVKY